MDKGSIDMDGFELAISGLSSRDEANRLAAKLKKEANSEEIDKAIKIAKKHQNRMVHWFVQALEEVPVKA
jgi:hypothetical protein